MLEDVILFIVFNIHMSNESSIQLHIIFSFIHSYKQIMASLAIL